jgi:hypothetical protein
VIAKRPDAELFDEQGKHFGGPTWQTDSFQEFTQHAEHNSILTGSGVQP